MSLDIGLDSSHFEDVPIVNLNSVENQLMGSNGRVYREIHPNLWAVKDAPFDGLAYLGTSRHGSGIVLRPLFAIVGGVWRNVQTNQPAPQAIVAQLDVYMAALR